MSTVPYQGSELAKPATTHGKVEWDALRAHNGSLGSCEDRDETTSGGVICEGWLPVPFATDLALISCDTGSPRIVRVAHRVVHDD